MIKFLIKRFFYALLIIWGVITVVFFLFNILPGDPAKMMLGQRADLFSVEAINKELGLDRSKTMQYIKYVNDISPISVFNTNNPENYFYFDTTKYNSFSKLFKIGKNTAFVLKYPYLRRSYQSKKQVSEIIRETLPNTFILALVSIVFATLLGIFMGIMAAIKKDGLYDRLSLFFSAFGMSLPSFFAAILVGWIFAFILGDLTGLNLTGNLYEIDDMGGGQYLQLKNLILPAFTLGIRPLAIVIQLSRNSMLEVLSQDYIRTARAKGLKFSRIIWNHALKNSLNPVITAVSGWFASLMTGVVFVEYIFGWKGLGFIIVDSLNKFDLPVVVGCVLTISIIFILINTFVDILYAILDPRIRLS
ncbi:MAG: ABC transporter permease [Bacteroidetes bacterium GWF2_33_16]|nr:MAG: ABC transporter permease [Bacteroidetes bacterium GWE2_32_14]OFY07286.1 MAG: ABC transporter permease [Bacteroidetes bacterium GWF2_33_16]